MNRNSTVGLVLNINKKKAFLLASRVIDWLQKNEVKFLMEERAAQEYEERVTSADYNRMRSEADLIMLFGGDGTFLHTAHHFIGTDIPLLGINLGGLGFLTEIEIEEIETTLNQLLTGNYTLEKRMLLEAQVRRDNKTRFQAYALNDVALNRGANARMVQIKLFINDEFINSYKADGLVISTPTGSTAYSLSAGGPIINPQIRAILITPICPHTLYVRPMVISEEERLQIEVAGEDGKMMITADGNYDCCLLTGDQIRITASQKEISLIKLPDKTFYSILHKKMRVGLV